MIRSLHLGTFSLVRYGITRVLVIARCATAITAVYSHYYRTTCISRQPQWRILLEQSFTAWARMPLLTETTPWVKKRWHP